jgi:hypothetical protein
VLRSELPSAKVRIAISKIAGSAFKSQYAVPYRTVTLCPQARHNACGWP